jgi:ParB/RepB/Spo0J family partition protein
MPEPSSLSKKWAASITADIASPEKPLLIDEIVFDGHDYPAKNLAACKRNGHWFYRSADPARTTDPWNLWREVVDPRDDLKFNQVANERIDEIEIWGAFNRSPFRHLFNEGDKPMNPPNETVDNAPVGVQTPPPPQPEQNPDCPKCGQVIYLVQDTKPDGKIVCDACKAKFKNIEALMKAVDAQRAAEVRQPAKLTAENIPVDLIDPNPHQPRQDFNQAKMEELAGSIKEHGVIQPIVVERNGERYMLHAGERRWRASKMAGLPTIPAYIVPAGSSPKNLLVRAVVENVQRADMNPLELAKAFQEMADMGMSDAQIAQEVSKSRSAVANTRRLLQLPEDRQKQVSTGELNERQALALLPLYALPETAREKVLDTWQGRELAKPEKLNSDDIRQRYNDAISHIGSRIEIIDPATPYTGDGIYHSTCPDCDCCIKKTKDGNDDLRCINTACLKVKQDIVKRTSLEQAKAATGLDYLDPSIEYKWDQTGGFYDSDGRRALQIAKEKSCPNLRLKFSEYSSNARLEGFDKVAYCCLYPGDSKKCSCEKAAEIEEKQAEKVKKAAIKQAKDQVASRLAEFFRLIPLPCLRAILYSEYRYENWKQSKVLEMTQEKLASEMAAVLIGQNVRFGEYVPVETSQKEAEDWLAKMGFSFDPVPNLDRRLKRIEDWIASPPEEGDKLTKATAGNLTNLANLAEGIYSIDGHDDQKELQDLILRIDAAKRTLLTWQAQAERRATAKSVEPTPALPAANGHTPAARSMEMRGHWSCGRCNKDFPPGTRYWVDGYDKGICADCLAEVEKETSEGAATAEQVFDLISPDEIEHQSPPPNSQDPSGRDLVYLREQLSFVAGWLERTPSPTLLGLRDYRNHLAGLVQPLAQAEPTPPGLDELLAEWEKLDDQLGDRIENFQFKPLKLEPQSQEVTA